MTRPHRGVHRRLTAKGQHPERGFSLIEIMVVLLILSIALPIIASLLQSVTNDSIVVQSRAAAEGQAQIIGEALSRQVHAATYPTGGGSNNGSEFVAADGDYMEFYASLGDTYGPRQITLSFSKACSTCTYYNLVEQYVIPTTGPVYSSTAVSEILGTGVVLPSSESTGCPSSGTTTPVFEYFDKNGTCLQTAAATTSTPYPLTFSSSSSFTSIDSVTVNLTTLDIQRPKTSPEPVYTLTLSLPNIDYAQVNA